MDYGVVLDRKPRYGHILAMFGLFLSLITLTFQGVNAPHTIAFGSSEVFDMSNQYRINTGLPELTANATLTISAQAKADHMASNRYFDHNAPDGTTPWAFFDSAGYSYTSAGENLALTNQSASSVVKGWYDSAGHRANMLSADFTEVGYGIAFVPSFTYKNVTYNNVYLVAAHYAVPSGTLVGATQASDSGSPIEPTQEKVQRTSGTLEVASQDQPRLSTTVAYIGLGLGAILVVVGATLELRKVLRHPPLHQRP